MDFNSKTKEYEKLISKIKRNRVITTIFTAGVMLAVLFFATPLQLEIAGVISIDRSGLPILVVILLVILSFFIGAFVYAFVSLPIDMSMDRESDPEKNLVLNTALNKSKNIDHVYAADYIFLGNYQSALYYAIRMCQSSNCPMQAAGYLQKARCEFLMGNYDYLKRTTAEYANTVLRNPKIKGKQAVICQKMYVSMQLMCAIADKDAEGIKVLCSMAEVWRPSLAAEGFINYLKGLASCITEDKTEAIYRFKWVEENCPKTVFAELSAEQLTKLQ